MRVVDLSTGAIYNSIAEAARGAGVDAANLRKVLQGKRKSAGGRMFVTAEDNVRPRDVAALQRWAEGGLTERERKQQKTYAKKHEAKQAAKRKQQKKTATRQQRQQQQTIKKAAYEAMRKANEYIRKQSAKGAEKASLTDLEALAQIVGEKKKRKSSDVSVFNLSPRTLAGKSEEEIKQITQQIQKFIANDLERRRQYAEIRAAQYHITVQEAASEDMMDALDNLTKAFERMRKWFPNPEGYRYSGRFKYREIYDDLVVDAQSMTAKEIQNLADDLNTWMQEERQHNEEELKDIYDRWKKSLKAEDETDEGGEEDGDYDPIIVRWD